MLFKWSRISVFIFLAGLALLLLPACDSNPASTEQEITADDLQVELTFSTDHIHTLSEVEIEAEVTGPQGEAFTDLEGVEVERRLEGEEDWHGTELTQEGTPFVGTYTFRTSGDYEIRVTGRLAGEGEPSVLYERPDLLGVGRAHVEKDGYRIEFENFPGHVHEGEEATLKFWVEKNENPVEGITAEIHCTDPSGAEETHEPHQHEGGVYEAQHSLEEAGEAHFAIHFPGNGGEIEADFHVPIAHGH